MSNFNSRVQVVKTVVVWNVLTSGCISTPRNVQQCRGRAAVALVDLLMREGDWML